MKHIGFIGCGAIGSFVAQLTAQRFKNQLEIVGVCDTDTQKAKELSCSLRKEVVCSLDELCTRADIIVEAAHRDAAAALLEKTQKQEKDIIILSSGVFSLYPDWIEKIKADIRRVHIPSGAVCGIDGIHAAAVGAILEVMLITRKPSRAFCGVPYVTERGIQLDALREAQVIFEGSAQEACSYFPQNINVASTIALAGIGMQKTKVRIIADPKITINSHEIVVKGESGQVQVKVTNEPFIENPKTSKLAAYSVMALLERMLSPLKIG